MERIYLSGLERVFGGSFGGVFCSNFIFIFMFLFFRLVGFRREEVLFVFLVRGKGLWGCRIDFRFLDK